MCSVLNSGLQTQNTSVVCYSSPLTLFIDIFSFSVEISGIKYIHKQPCRLQATVALDTLRSKEIDPQKLGSKWQNKTNPINPSCIWLLSPLEPQVGINCKRSLWYISWLEEPRTCKCSICLILISRGKWPNFPDINFTGQLLYSALVWTKTTYPEGHSERHFRQKKP